MKMETLMMIDVRVTGQPTKTALALPHLRVSFAPQISYGHVLLHCSSTSPYTFRIVKPRSSLRTSHDTPTSETPLQKFLHLSRRSSHQHVHLHCTVDVTWKMAPDQEVVGTSAAIHSQQQESLPTNIEAYRRNSTQSSQACL